MRMNDLILKKRAKGILSDEEIKAFIAGYTKGEIPDYQVSALLMTIVFNGMNKEEIASLTDAMLHSGEVCDLSSIPGIKVDKHSTGGVGDKTSLVLGPMVAACGVSLAKMSGRGLGHTGGTLDKLESIPGLSIAISGERFLKQVREIGIAIIGQTGDLVPADKKLYALRDVTGTVDSIPLIASSIMSKKLASGSDTILLDVKFGKGAFMKDLESARELATTMVEIGKSFGRDTKAEITDMNEPLGKAIGNSLEVIEAVNTLLGHGPEDLTELCLDSGSTMLLQARVVSSKAEGRKLIESKIVDGSAFEKFCQMVEAQGGDSSYLRDTKKFKVADYKLEVFAKESGYVKQIDALEVGLTGMKLGAGRETKDDLIDMAAGIVLEKKVGDKVNVGDLLATLYTEKSGQEWAIDDVRSTFILSKDKVVRGPIVLESIK